MSANATTTPYPEHDKVHKVVKKSQAIHDFLEWVHRKYRFEFAFYHVHGPDCVGWDTEAECINRSVSGYCDYHVNRLYSATYNEHKLLAEFFEIDLDKLEAEKEDMLKRLREANDL